MNLKKSIFIIMLAYLIVGCSSGEPEATSAPAVSVADQQAVVSAEAFVIPVGHAVLSFETGGKVIEVFVAEGDTVKQGDRLAQVDDSIKQTELAQQEANLETTLANLAKAEAELAKVKAPPTPEEIAEKEAALARVEAVLAEKLAGPTPEEIAQKEATIHTARAQLNEVLAGSRDEDIQKQASSVLQAEATVRDRQRVYDRVRYGDPADVQIAGTDLQRATLDYEQAQVEYQKLLNGSTNEQIAIQQAQVAERQTDLARLLAGSTAEQIAQAQADVARAEADLARLLAGATDEDIIVAEAAVAAAQANVEVGKVQIERVKTELEKYQLLAPFAGEIGLINVEEGEVVTSGSQIISIGDFSQWQVETDDLTEIDVVKVKVGQIVNISVDALPDEVYKGHVVRVNPRSETKAGDVTYTVLIDISEGDTSKLMWGMTTFIDIEVEE